MKGLMRGVVVAGAVASVVVGFGSSVEARPPYKKVFESTYEKVAKDNKVDCNTCHVADKEKKERNNYGEALAKNIKAKESDDAKIKEALEKTEKEKSAIKDKTFGDLLKDGKLPASK
jgi:hypothetical protein